MFSQLNLLLKQLAIRMTIWDDGAHAMDRGILVDTYVAVKFF